MNEEEIQTETVQTNEEVVEPKATEADDKELKSALAQKDHFREKFEKEQTERKALEAKLNESAKGAGGLNVEDYIDISASLEGLDHREKERLAKEHKLTGRPLAEIREDEDFKLWQEAYHAKVEKERSLSPTSTQSDPDPVLSLDKQLENASLDEKEEFLRSHGLLKESRPRPDRREIKI